MSDISQVVKTLCAHSAADVPSAVSISPAAMRGAFAAILDGGATDLELGALMAASALLQARCVAEPFAELVLGLHDAIRERILPLHIDSPSVPVVVLPNYGDEGRTATVPLLALLLRRLGIRVMVHGALETYGGLFNCGVLREFGVLPATTRGQAERQLCEGGVALVPATLFSPGLAAMLSLRNRLGIVTPAHTLANLLMPLSIASPSDLHVVEVSSWLKPYIENENLLYGSRVLLLSASREHVVAESCRPQISFRDIDRSSGWEILFEAEHHGVHGLDGGSAATRHLPQSGDPRAWARWTRAQLAGEAMLPAPVVNLLASSLYACGYAGNINQAKAIAAVEVSSLAA